MGTVTTKQLLVNLLQENITRRERLKSALYLFLKNEHAIVKFFSSRKCRIVPQNVKGGTLRALLTYILLQNIKKHERGTLKSRPVL